VGEPFQQSITLGVRFPLGSSARYQAKLANAQADVAETQAKLANEQEQLVMHIESLRRRVEASKTIQAAAEKREMLTQESRGFFEKSFRLGQTDLPTRLRIELEALDATKQAARTRIDVAASISTLRQALGLLPE
jgi:outer membrane protein, heavy metal efflux system